MINWTLLDSDDRIEFGCVVKCGEKKRKRNMYC